MTVHSILCPIDFGVAAEEALRYAVSLAAQLRAGPVHVLHVHQAAAHGEGVVADRRMKQDAARRLEDVTKRYSVHDVELVPHLIDGVPYEAILTEAERLGVDLIVMGTHGRIGRLHALLGSVAEGVVRNAPCPVLTVRERTGSAESFAERRHRRRSIAEGPR